jgi:hypothetical protein
MRALNTAILVAALGIAMTAHAQITFRAQNSAVGTADAPVFGAASSATMPVPAFRAASSATTTGATLTVAMPAGTVQNDVMVLAIAVRPTAATITATGWTLVRRLDNNNPNANSLVVYYKVAGAAEPANYSFPIGGGGSTHTTGGIQSFFNVDTANPVGVENGQNTANGTAHAAPSVTTTVPNSMVVTLHSLASATTWTPPGGMTESFDIASSPPNAVGQTTEGNWLLQAARGATGVLTANAAANADVGNAAVVVLKPALRINIPAGTAVNDILIASVGVTPSTTAVTPPAGWTLIRRIDNATATTNSLYVYRKFVTASEPAFYEWSVSNVDFAVGGIQSFRGVDTANPVDVENGQNTASGTNHDTPSVTTTVANAMLVTSHTYASSRTWTPVTAGLIEAFDQPSGANSATGQSISGNYQLDPTAGATGTKRSTAAGNADRGNTHIVALRPGNMSITINTPAGTAVDDVMIASIGFNNSAATITPPAGWVLQDRINNPNTTSNSLAVYIRVAIAGEPASHTWTVTGAAFLVGGIQGFSGVDPVTPVDVKAGQCTPQAACTANTTAHPTPSVITTVVNAMIVTSHTYASSRTWTPPAGMTESFDRPSGGNSATGQSIEGARVLQPGIGATGAKSATAAGDGDVGATHILALRPFVLSTPGSFNAFETATGAGAIAGQIYAKRVSTAFSLDVVAILSGAQFAGFTNTVAVDLVTGSAGGLNCPGTPVAVSATQNVNLTAGRGTTGGFNVATAFPNVRVRIQYPVASPTVVACSTDNFSIRPTAFAIPTSNMTNATSIGTPVAKAGDAFTITVVGGAGYNGTPSIDSSLLTAHAGALQVGAVGGTFGVANPATGTATGATFTYSEVGNFTIGVNGVFDDAFTSVDQAAGDCTNDFSNGLVGGKYGCKFGNSPASAAIGRFTPDHFDVTLNTPTFATACGAGSYTYIGQLFSYTVQPVITVTAKNSAGLGNATTRNYTDTTTWFKLTNTSLTGKSYTAATGVLDTSVLPGTDPVVADTGAGTASITFSSGGVGAGLFFARATPVAQFDADISLAINVIDTDGVVLATNPARFGQATAGNGIAFNNGKQMRFGRLAIRNANGSQLVALPMLMETQYWNGSSFITNTADSCTAIAATNIAMSNYTSNLNACETSLTVSAFASGRATALLSAPGSANNGSVILIPNLGSSGSGNTCIAGVATPVTGASRAYLYGQWDAVDQGGDGLLFDDDPAARAIFGVFKGAEEVIFVRENF